MGFIDNLTGKDALEAMNRNIDEMEQVYAAFATRMIEILDKEERLDRSVSELGEIIAGLSGTDTGERLASILERLTEPSGLDEIRRRLSVNETQNLSWLRELETKLGQRISKNASSIDTITKNDEAMRSALSRLDQEISKSANEQRRIGEEMVVVKARVTNAFSQINALCEEQIDQNAKINRLLNGYKWLLGGLFVVLFIAIGLAASGCGGM